jgi:hypothetical protein
MRLTRHHYSCDERRDFDQEKDNAEHDEANKVEIAQFAKRGKNPGV